MKKNNKLISLAVLATFTTASIYLLNKSINIIANSKATIGKLNGEKYSWRFGDIFYTKRGEGKPVLLIHELACGSSDLEWKKIVEEYSKTNTVYTLDLLGCGRSDKPALTYTNFLYVQMISDFIKNVIGKRTDVVCTGTSAQFVIMACHNDDTLFDKIAIINPESVYESSMISTNKKLVKLLIETPVIGTTLFNICNSMKSFKKLLTDKYFSKEVDDSTVKDYYDAAHYGAMSSKYLFGSIAANYTNINIMHALKSINNSIVIIGGEDEENIRMKCIEYKDYNPAVEYVILEECKHLPQLEQPEKLLESLKIYLA